jgi:hypothetical protein
MFCFETLHFAALFPIWAPPACRNRANALFLKVDLTTPDKTGQTGKKAACPTL